MFNIDSQWQHITVCICTYKRPKYLEYLLEKLNDQQTVGDFTYSIVVVDNDPLFSAKATVNTFQISTGIPVRYEMESRKGYAYARNRAIACATGNYVAFIDDDEYPGSDWLLRLYNALEEYGADGILGPVLPQYDGEPPKWVIEGKLCERKSFKTGTVIQNSTDTRTGNVLFKRVLFSNNREPFDPRFSISGGEDTDFFRRMMDKGKIFVWCDEAPVWEWVPKERMQKLYFMERALSRGVANSKKTRVVSVDTCKSLAAIIFYTIASPVFLLIGEHLFMKFMVRNCDHIGKMLGHVGIKINRQ